MQTLRPAAGSTTRLVLPDHRSRPDLNCADFESWDEAQDALKADPADPHGLDADDDGIPCEELR